MEDLPSDVAQTILRKVAVQDPSSLLTLTCACANFYREAKPTPEIWKEAWYAPLYQPQAEQSVSALETELSAKLDTEILALGGYKKLVIARWARVAQGRFLSDEELEEDYFEIVQAPRRSGSIGEKEYTSPRTRFLVIIRGEGRLLFWGLYKADVLKPPYYPAGDDETDWFSLSYDERREPSRNNPNPAVASLMIHASRLEPVCLDAPIDNIQEQWKAVGKRRSRSYGVVTLELQEPTASMEIYACLDERTDIQKLPPTRKGKTWDCLLFLRPPGRHYPSHAHRSLDLGFSGRFCVFVKEAQKEDVQASLLMQMAQAALQLVSGINEKLCQAETWIADLFG